MEAKNEPYPGQPTGVAGGHANSRKVLAEFVNPVLGQGAPDGKLSQLRTMVRCRFATAFPDNSHATNHCAVAPDSLTISAQSGVSLAM
jgi:hypothetical protein